MFANVTAVAERFQSTVYHRRVREMAYPISYTASCEKLFKGLEEDQNVLGGTSDIAILTTDKPFVYKPNAVEVERLNLVQPDRTNRILSEVNRADALVLGFGKEPNSQTTGLLRFGKNIGFSPLYCNFYICSCKQFVEALKTSNEEDRIAKFR